MENYGGRAIFAGDTVFLKSHTGKLVDVEGAVVQARYKDRGDWQKLVVEKLSGGAIFSGDAIFLKAHTGNIIDVSGLSVQARWAEQSEWQRLVIHRSVRRRLEDILV